ncbi:MAG: GntR family transcriptional regulator, partial [Bryobacteraceae bacterium]
LVREALQQLIHEGLVEQTPHKGARVVRLTPEQMDEILGIRLLLECAAVRQAALRLTRATRTELRGIARQMAAEQDATRFAQLDLQLHHRIWELSGNRTITKLLDQVTGPLFAMSLLMRSAEQRRRRNDIRRGDHRQLVEAICTGKEKPAEDAMRLHLTENWPVIKERITRFLAEEEA